MSKNDNKKNFLILHVMLFLFSFCGVFSKLAGQSQFLSFNFILFYGISMMILFVYTLAWQQILKRIPLVTAFLNKSITIIWSMIWGVLIFNEVITLNMLLGCGIVLIGVSLVVSSNE